MSKSTKSTKPLSPGKIAANKRALETAKRLGKALEKNVREGKLTP